MSTQVSLLVESKEEWEVVITDDGKCYIVPPMTTPGDMHSYYVGDLEDTCAQCHKQAYFVVRACNSHNVLLAACGSAIWVLENRHNKDSVKWDEYARAAIEDLRNAIAETEKGD